MSSSSKNTSNNRSRNSRESYKPRYRTSNSAMGTYADVMHSKTNAFTPPLRTVESQNAPVSSSYADIMASSQKVISPNDITPSSYPFPAPKVKGKPSPLISDHAPLSIVTSEISTFELPSPLSTPQPSEAVDTEDKIDLLHPLNAEWSVLFAPAEKKVNRVFGEWKNLKGNPVQLERLNQPRTHALESRWSC